MQHEQFDPAAWLDRWKQAGGAWATSIIMRPRQHADDQALDALCRELDEDKQRALAEHLEATTR